MAFVRFNSDNEKLRSLLDSNIYDGTFSRDIDLSLLKEKFIGQIESSGSDVMRSGDSLLVGQMLEWDTGYFGYPCYRISYLRSQNGDAVVPDVLEFLRNRKVRLAFLRLNTEDPLRVNLPNDPAFRICSTKIMFRKELTGTHLPDESSGMQCETLMNMPAAMRERAEKEIIGRVPELFVTNHFRSDERISSEQATGVYSEWIRNIIRDRPQDMLCLTSGAGEPCAFSIVKGLGELDSRYALLELIGSLTRGKKYGGYMLRATESLLRKRGQSMFYAITDISNYAAQNLFTSNGFVSYNSVDEYHCWIY